VLNNVLIFTDLSLDANRLKIYRRGGGIVNEEEQISKQYTIVLGDP
jgi:hypothetical protein